MPCFSEDALEHLFSLALAGAELPAQAHQALQVVGPVWFDE
jgi:hypothetical protein